MKARISVWAALHLVTATGLSLACDPARADLISGTFAGVATSGSFLTSGGSVDVTGSPVTGSFNVGSVAGATALPGGLPGEYLLPGGAISYSFFVSKINQTTNYGTSPTRPSAYIDLSDNGTSQSVFLDAAFVDPGVLTALDLTGPEGSLFGNVNDVSSLHAGPGVSLASPISLSIRFQGSASIAVTSQAVPEPASWAILAGCVGAMAGLLAFGGARTCPTRE